ncbi:hypothetical protein ACO0K9_08290 [Undibacterium sp. Ji50W]|uniref:hypothetical protein n=1 Tax=Undibacterium sp. Ji50W TaxID=3413041 RepID=UPI003BF07DD7
MANKALATRQRMQFRVEPAQVAVYRTQQHSKKMPPAYRGLAVNNQLPFPAVNATRKDKSGNK